MRCALVFVAAVGACGTPHGRVPDAPERGDGGGSGHTDAPHVDASTDGRAVDAHVDAPAMADAFPSVLDMHLNCHNDCTLIANPPSIAVTAGTGFQVNWINTGDTPCDVAKIDPFNQVPIVLDLEPGTSYFDSVRTWCGTLFTGTFQFRIDICTLPSYIDVNCGL